MRSAGTRIVLYLGLVLIGLGCPSSAWSQDNYDWTQARRQAERASSQKAEAAWGNLAYLHLRLGSYYDALADVSAYVQIDIARRRVSYEPTTAAAAAYAFTVHGRFDSAGVWARRDPTLAVFVQFAQARSQNREFQFDAETQSATGAELIDALLIGLHYRATGLEQVAQRLRPSASESQPLAALVKAVVSGDSRSIPEPLAQVESGFAHPPGQGAPLLEQFGNPLIYSALAQAHFHLAVDACDQALSKGSGAYASTIHLFRGLGWYGIGDYESANDDLAETSNSDFAGIASAYLAGVAWHQNNSGEVRRWVDKCLNAERENRNGEALVALARVQADAGAQEWPTAAAAREIIHRRPDSRRAIYAAYWAAALLAGYARPDSARQLYWHAANKRLPDIRHGFPDVYASRQELFCAHYTTALVIGGSRGRGMDYLDAFNGMMELSKFIPASEPVKEGLRWLSYVANKDDQEKPKS
jgi:hypothetical protein